MHRMNTGMISCISEFHTIGDLQTGYFEIRLTLEARSSRKTSQLSVVHMMLFRILYETLRIEHSFWKDRL